MRMQFEELHSMTTGDGQASSNSKDDDGLVENEQSNVRVLVVDDEDYIVDVLQTTLRFVGFQVETAQSGHEAMAKVPEFMPEVMLLDRMLPDTDGIELCKKVRENGSKVPVLFLTARDATEDKIQGLAIGADDYITKPFSLEEVVARINAVLRRTQPDRFANNGKLSYGDLELDEETHVVSRAGRRIDLSPTEFKLLSYLMSNAEKVMSKAQILDYVWQYDFGGDANVVETYISYLRKKIDIYQPPLIHTVRMVGYVLREPLE
jgi:two-component system, OmpR family, response regulator